VIWFQRITSPRLEKSEDKWGVFRGTGVGNQQQPPYTTGSEIVRTKLGRREFQLQLFH
jgi:hypothetical protein